MSAEIGPASPSEWSHEQPLPNTPAATPAASLEGAAQLADSLRLRLTDAAMEPTERAGQQPASYTQALICSMRGRGYSDAETIEMLYEEQVARQTANGEAL